MNRLCRARPAAALAFVLALTALMAENVGAQSADAGGSRRPWTPARMPDGQYDLQGIWTNGTLTPFERPLSMADKPFLTEAEAAEQNRLGAERRANASANRRPGDVGSDNEAFVDRDYKVLSTRQSSQVVDPPDGRVPLLQAAEQKRAFNVSNVDSYESMSPWDRCITRGPTGMFPAGYNNAYQIIQSPGYIVMVHEMIHEARVIPVDGRPHLDARIRQWTGDSRGRWEGTTLVVETTNFHNRGWITTHAGSGRLRGVPHSEGLRLVERFTRIDADTIRYEMTIEDSSAYSKSWTVSVPLSRNDGYQMFEYACHEGNQATALILRGARTLEKEQDAGGAKP